MTPAGYTCHKCGQKTADYLGNCWNCGPLTEDDKIKLKMVKNNGSKRI